jgi:Phage integrase, N-terminal SAM-like domain
VFRSPPRIDVPQHLAGTAYCTPISCHILGFFPHPVSPKTQLHYIRHVKSFADFLGGSAHNATAEDVHRYQLQLASIGATVPTVNVSATALRFFFKVTLKRSDLAEEVVSAGGGFSPKPAPAQDGASTGLPVDPASFSPSGCSHASSAAGSWKG